MKRFLIPLFAMLLLFGCNGEGFSFEKDLKSLPEIGDSCDTNAQCGDHAYCERDTYTCAPTTQFDHCDANDDCARGLECINGICQDEYQGSCLDNCTQTYEPVCGANGITYNNRCFATCDNTEVVNDGRCDPICVGDAVVCALYCENGFKKDANGCDTCECNKPTCDCPEYYAPVCGTDGKTYGNQCFARCANVTVKYEGQCNDPNIMCNEDSDCKDGYYCEMPVVCDPNLDQPCYDDNAIGMMEKPGICVQKEICGCPEYEAPVCGVNGKTYSNECFAKCDRVEIKHDGKCEQVNCWEQCPGVLDPVCTAGNQTYINRCLAECEGKEIMYDGYCAECSPLACLLWCENGFKKDDKGCDICECNDPEPRECFTDGDCPEGQFCALMDCADGFECYGGGVCMQQDCQPVMCDLYCEFGFAKDERGCETCDCNPNPYTECNSDADCAVGEFCALVDCAEGFDCYGGGICMKQDCQPVDCEMYCEFGFAKDDRGCETCSCNPNPNTECRSDADCAADEECFFLFYNGVGTCTPVEPVGCQADSDCPTGTRCEFYSTDTGEQYGQCVPDYQCDPITCDLWCPDGYKTGSDGCQTCECNEPTPQECSTNDECPEGQECMFINCTDPTDLGCGDYGYCQ